MQSGENLVSTVLGDFHAFRLLNKEREREERKDGRKDEKWKKEGTN